MDDPKVSDKRKAPDKNDSMEELNESSIIEQPLKRPRLDTVEQEQFVLMPGTAAEVVDLEQAILPDDTLGTNVSGIMEPEEILLADEQIMELNDKKEDIEGIPLENGSSSKEELELLGSNKSFVQEVQIGDDDGENNNTPVGSQDSTKFMVVDSEPSEEKHRISGSNGDHKSTKSNLQPENSSSPLCDSDNSSIIGEVNISIKAFNPKTHKLIYEEPCIRSDYLRLEAFLNAHKLSMTAFDSIGSGYMGDEDSGQHHFVPPLEHRRGHRWTSSTLGSGIPRESIKTVYSITPTDSPNQDRNEVAVPTSGKKRGKNDPKLSSTRLSDEIETVRTRGRNSDKQGKVVVVSNGETGSNGFDKNRFGSTSKASDKKSSPSNGDGSSKSASKRSSKTTPAASTSDKSGNKSRTTTPKSRSVSREFARVSADSPLTVQPPLAVEPSPARAVAIVEGGAAKPLTRFEQEVNNEAVDISSLKYSKTLWGSIAPNSSVFARWSDKNYYSGVVREKGLNDTWIIDFDDATTYPASEGHIIPIKILGVGIKGVYCPDTGYHPADANVLGQKFVNDPDIGETVKYAIKLVTKNEDNGKVLWCTRRMLSIKDNDARILRQEYQPSAKLKAAEVSLENIIPESSRRRVTGTPKSVTPAAATPKSIRKVVGGAFDASTAEEKDSHNESKTSPKIKSSKKIRKRKFNESTPSSSSSRSRSDISTLLNSSDISTSKESPRKKSKDRDGRQSVFEGYKFFLTASGGGDPASLGSHTSSSIPYDKDEYRDLIESKGGTIIDVVGKEKGKDKTVLISDNFARTVKYIYCLAASIPCVSHQWIQECITQNKIIPWKPYELNAGFSLEENKVIAPHKLKPLKGFEVYITASSDDLYNYWKPVLMAAQAKLLKPNKVKGKIVDNEIPTEAKVLVTDSTCLKEVLGKAHERMLPVVKPEWLVQSIISGKKADFFNHEKYRVEIYDPDEYEEDDDEEPEDSVTDDEEQS